MRTVSNRFVSVLRAHTRWRSVWLLGSAQAPFAIYISSPASVFISRVSSKQDSQIEGVRLV